MKKIENNFAVTGFVGKDAEIRQFTNASVARFPLAVSRLENNGEEARIWLKKAVQTSDMYICSSAYQLLYEIEKRTNHPDTAVKYAE